MEEEDRLVGHDGERLRLTNDAIGKEKVRRFGKKELFGYRLDERLPLFVEFDDRCEWREHRWRQQTGIPHSRSRSYARRRRDQ